MILQKRASLIETPTGERILEILGHETGAIAPKHSVAEVYMDPGATSLKHYHPIVEESYWLIEGQAHLEVDAETIDFKAGDMIQIPVGAAHKITNTGKGTLKMIVCCAPAWTPDCSVFTEEWDGEKVVPKS
ncbi:MAG: cupin domain-containing protein [Verrucomicrobiota bacterium]